MNLPSIEGPLQKTQTQIKSLFNGPKWEKRRKEYLIDVVLAIINLRRRSAFFEINDNRCSLRSAGLLARTTFSSLFIHVPLCVFSHGGQTMPSLKPAVQTLS